MRIAVSTLQIALTAFCIFLPACGGDGKVDIPKYSHTSANINSGTYVEIYTKTPDAKIFYTLDGSEPEADNGIRFLERIKVDKNMQIKAIAVKEGATESDVATINYAVNRGVNRISTFSYDHTLIRHEAFEYFQSPSSIKRSYLTENNGTYNVASFDLCNYNAYGLKSDCFNHGMDGNLMTKELYEYDSHQKLAKTLSYDNDETLLMYTVYEYDYDNLGIILSTYRPDHSLYAKRVRKYFSNGNLKEEIFQDDSDSITGSRLWEYNEVDQIKKYSIFDESADIIFYHTYQYNPDGDLYQRSQYGSDGAPLKYEIYHWLAF